MATNFLALFAEKNSFTYFGRNKIFGTYNGFESCLIKHRKAYYCYFAAKLEENCDFVELVNEQGEKYGISALRKTPPIYALKIQGTQITQSMDFLTALLQLCHAGGTRVCAFCGKPIAPEQKHGLSVDGIILTAHAACIQDFRYLVNGMAQQLTLYRKVVSNKIPLQIAFPLFACLITFLIYALTGFRQTWLLQLCALAIGVFCAFGYILNHGKTGRGYYNQTLLISLAFCILLHMFCHAVFLTPQFTLPAGLMIYLRSWTIRGAVLNQLLPQLAILYVISAVGIFSFDVYRLLYVLSNTIKIKETNIK